MNSNQDSKKPQGEVQPVQIDGFKQVLDMLKVADPAFRESLLRRLAARDSNLALNLRRDLKDQEL